MAIYHLSMKIIGGGSGRTAIAAAAYRRGEKLHNEHDGKIHDYARRRNAISAAAYRRGDELFDGKNTYDFTNKKGIVYSEIILPKHALREYLNSQTLWNAAQNAEKQHNARTAREIVIALPNELTPEQKIKVVRDYVQRNFVDEGMCADFSFHAGHIHTRKGEIYPFEDLAIRKENPHVHIQLTVRPLNEDGTFCKTKTRKEYILDKNGERIRTKSGKGWVSRNVGLTDWDKTETLIKWREDWAVTVNKEFERLGIDERISHLSLKEQGINRKPTKHMGHEAWSLEKKGVKTKIGNENRTIMARNKALEQAQYIHELKQGYVIIDKEIAVLNNEFSNIEREMNLMKVKAREIEERVKEIYTLERRIEELKFQRLNMGVFTSKKAIDEQIHSLGHSYEQATDYLNRKHYIAPEESNTKIKQLESKMKDMELMQERLQDKLSPLVAEKEFFKSEYHRQKWLAENSPNGQQVHDRLKQLSREARAKVKFSRDDMARAKSERNLDKLTDENFQEILKGVQPEQAKALLERRELEKKRNKDIER